MMRAAKTVAAAVAAVLLLAACAGPTVRTESTPVPSDVSADLQPFYEQVLTWSECEDGMQCATATAPLDWEDPSRDSIDLALIRQAATGGDPKGSVLVNPGGPGGSGYDFVAQSVDYAASDTLQRNFDIVGFDPRGVNRSSAVSCHDDPAELDAFLYDITPGVVGTDEWIAAAEAANTAFGAQCLEHTGELLGYVDTVSAARDLDLLRAVLGDEKLNYLGYSYGTLLGATYAELYPENTGRLVLDGALDPTSTSFDVSLTQAEGFESAMRAFLADCATVDECPFTGSIDDSMTMIRALLDRLDVSPIRNTDGRELGSNAMTSAIVLPLYSQDNWPYLQQLFASVMAGDASIAFTLADSYNGRNPDGSYIDNSLESRLAINCLDYASQGDVAVMREEAAELATAAPVLGKQLSYGDLGCLGWPVAASTERPVIAVQLESGHLVTYEGEGHTAYNKSNSCVDDTVDDYFIDGAVPSSDPLC
ncbi:pimeloyl-ACP methyl ester carboxylesterase [Conyzicola lurida]|uniref:Pimeloyl-ACP methyl ester carboxylesterase n=2 Tax=Conyzicola lurida TaxID=1172621 RepID=A0A841AMK0_9MICO|nr:pimeloyl-ACP methyl ester carboxylesterase [Conyzicola lurida]